MKTRPKLIAARDFSTAGEHFAKGDPVTNPIVLDAVLRFGDRYVVSTTSRSRSASDPAEPDEPTTPTEE